MQSLKKRLLGHWQAGAMGMMFVVAAGALPSTALATTIPADTTTAGGAVTPAIKKVCITVVHDDGSSDTVCWSHEPPPNT
jgi:hypothetical protein